jgi:hypothetical protein
MARAMKSDGVVNTSAIVGAGTKLGREWVEKLSDAGVTLGEGSKQDEGIMIVSSKGERQIYWGSGEGMPDVDHVRKSRMDGNPYPIPSEHELPKSVRDYMNGGAPPWDRAERTKVVDQMEKDMTAHIAKTQGVKAPTQAPAQTEEKRASFWKSERRQPSVATPQAQRQVRM